MSNSAVSYCGKWWITKFAVTTSNVSSRNGRSTASAAATSTSGRIRCPVRAIWTETSTPIATPSGPTASRANSTSNPVPVPTSRSFSFRRTPASSIRSRAAGSVCGLPTRSHVGATVS